MWSVLMYWGSGDCGVYEHLSVFEGAAGRSEWSAKREGSEREADHERTQGNGNVRLIAVLTNTGCCTSTEGLVTF